MNNTPTTENDQQDAVGNRHNHSSAIPPELMGTLEDHFTGIKPTQSVLIFKLNEEFRSAADLIARAEDDSHASEAIIAQLKRTKERVEETRRRMK